MVEITTKGCLKDTSEFKEDMEAKDLTLPKSPSDEPSSKVAKKRRVNFNLTIDFKKCDEFSVTDNCDAEQPAKALSSDFSDVESLCIPTTPGGRPQVEFLTFFDTNKPWPRRLQTKLQRNSHLSRNFPKITSKTLGFILYHLLYHRPLDAQLGSFTISRDIVIHDLNVK